MSSVKPVGNLGHGCLQPAYFTFLFPNTSKEKKTSTEGPAKPGVNTQSPAVPHVLAPPRDNYTQDNFYFLHTFRSPTRSWQKATRLSV